MFRNMRLATKLALGFGAVVAVVVALGGIGYVMFSRVDATVAELNNHNLPAAKYVVGVGRSAFECVLEEKNYVLYEKDEIHQRAKEKLAGLMSNLDEVDKVAREFDDDALAEKSKEVRTIAAQYGRLYEQGVATMKNNKTAAQKMNDTGQAVSKEARGYVKVKKGEYLEAADALAVVNCINAVALQTRMGVKAYMLSKEQRHADVLRMVDQNIAVLLESYDKLEKLNPNAAEQKQIADARQESQRYLEMAKTWVKELERDADSTQLAELAKSMDKAGSIVSRAAAGYLEAKQVQTDKIADSVFLVAQVNQTAYRTRLRERDYMLTRSEQAWTDLNKFLGEMGTLLDDLRKVSLTNEDEERIARAEKAAEAYLAAAKSWVGNDNELYKTILPQMKELGENVLTTAQAAENDAWKSSDEAAATVSGIVASSITIIVIALVVGVIVGIVTAMIMTRSITKPLKEIFQGLKAFSNAELKDTGDTFNRIIDGMTEGMTQVNDAAGQVSTASQQLAEGASEQASSLEETSSALEQVAAMTRTNAENSQQAKELSSKARDGADHGGVIVGQLNEATQGISDASDQISKILKVIEEIAFQTNLLALNAAVEAARAGEHGKGFAVVAEEVRNLAQRSAGAAKEINDLITNSTQRSQEGVKISGEVGTALEAIVVDVKSVSELITGIAQASQEQAQGVDQVNTAVAQMDKVTQQNAAGAEESASAAEQLSAQATATNALVDELVVLVRGANQAHGSGTRTTPAATNQKKKNASNIKVAHLRSESHTKPVAAMAGGNKGASSEEFLSLGDDDDKLNEF